MDSRRLGNILVGIGICGLLIAVFWWAQFYSEIARGLGDSSGDLPFQCLFSSGGVCGFVSGAARMMGAWAYDPIIFWLSAAGCVVGLVVRSSAR